MESGIVSFLRRDYRDGTKLKTMALEVQEFIRQFHFQVLPSGLIRNYGLLYNRYRRTKPVHSRSLLRQDDR